MVVFESQVKVSQFFSFIASNRSFIPVFSATSDGVLKQYDTNVNLPCPAIKEELFGIMVYLLMSQVPKPSFDLVCRRIISWNGQFTQHPVLTLRFVQRIDTVLLHQPKNVFFLEFQFGMTKVLFLFIFKIRWSYFFIVSKKKKQFSIVLSYINKVPF